MPKELPEDLLSRQGRLRASKKNAGMSAPALAEATGIKYNTVTAHLKHGRYKEAEARKYARATQERRGWLWLLHGDAATKGQLTKGDNISGNNDPQLISSGTDLVRIPEIDVAGGAGGGGIMPDAYKRSPDGSWMPTDAVKAEVFFPRSWLISLGLDPNSTDLVPVSGHSMSPEIEDGDWVFVDRRAHSFGGDGIYLFFDGFGIVVKSLVIDQRPSGEACFVVLSSNPTFPPRFKSFDEVRIIGRVRHRIGKIVRGR